MVKGVTKRVVVVYCPETRYFEQAIFMVREDALNGAEQERVLREACRAADSYIRLRGEKRRVPWGWIGAGAAVALVILGAIVLL